MLSAFRWLRVRVVPLQCTWRPVDHRRACATNTNKPLSVLLTVGLQNDLISLLGVGEPSPNAQHIGPKDSERLLGRNPHIGPMAQMLNWARRQPPADLLICHVRYVNALEPGAGRSFFSRFGNLCIKGTHGAEMVVGCESELQDDREVVIPSTGLNDIEDTPLRSLLEDAIQGDRPLRVGIVGVHTDVKISFLAYDLITRLRIADVATCSALTAGTSCPTHYDALSRLERVLGVRVCMGVGEFANWLLPGGSALSLPSFSAELDVFLKGFGMLSQKGRSAVDDAGPDSRPPPLSSADLSIVSFLFQHSRKVTLEQLAGAYGGCHVFYTLSEDSMGVMQAPSVVKIGPRQHIARERFAFEQIQEMLGNAAPSISYCAESGDRAGIRFKYAAMGRYGSQPFSSFFTDPTTTQAAINAKLHDLFHDIFGRIYSNVTNDVLDIFDHYSFNGHGWAWRYGGSDTPAELRKRIALVLPGCDPDASMLAFPGGFKYANVLRFLTDKLPGIRESKGKLHPVCMQHGDLHGRNILIDRHDNMWIIDFYDAGRAHALRDISKLESDILFDCTPVHTEDELVEVLRITHCLAGVRSLADPLPETLEGVTRPAAVRAYQSVRTLRTIVAEIVCNCPHASQMHIASLRYALHTLSFNKPHLTRVWALAHACASAEAIEQIVGNVRECMRVHWFPSHFVPAPGMLGLSTMPEMFLNPESEERHSDLFQSYSIQLVVAIYEDSDADTPARLEELLRGTNVKHRCLRVPSLCAPSLAEAHEVVELAKHALESGHNVLFTSLVGIARTGTLAACVLVRFGMSPGAAIQAVKNTRQHPRAVAAPDQADHVYDYAAYLRGLKDPS